MPSKDLKQAVYDRESLPPCFSKANSRTRFVLYSHKRFRGVYYSNFFTSPSPKIFKNFIPQIFKLKRNQFLKDLSVQ